MAATVRDVAGMNDDQPRSSSARTEGCPRTGTPLSGLLIVLTGVLVLVNAFFVIAEYALVRSRRARLQTLADEGARGARLALTQVDNISDYISACQVGITMASIAHRCHRRARDRAPCSSRSSVTLSATPLRS